MKQLIYHSRPFGFDEAMLAGILFQARRNNLKEEVTGALVCRHDLYIQLIEGPEYSIDQLYSCILTDDRHYDVSLVHSSQVAERMFPDWEMLDDSMPTMTRSPEEIAAGLMENTSREQLRAVFKKIAAKVGN